MVEMANKNKGSKKTKSGRLVGYARVSTEDQCLDLQLDALESAGCVEIHEDMASGARRDRDGLAEAIESLEPGDTLVVWRLDRLGRSVAHLSQLVEEMTERGIWIRSLTESIDTSTPMGRMLTGILGSIAEMERETIRARVKSGMSAAKRKGVHVGRKPKLTDAQVLLARRMLEDGESVSAVAKSFQVSRSALRASLAR